MRKFLALLAVATLFSSCSSIYMPNVPNTPMLSSNGELNASGHISLKGNVSLNSAYAVSDHMGVMLNGSLMNNSRTRKDFRHHLIETGAGYFNTFGPDRNRIIEIYGGLGRGNSQRIYRDENQAGIITEDRQDFRFNKTFLQANYSSKKKQDLILFGARFPLDYGTAFRLSYVRMTDFTRNGIDQVKEDNIFIEPVFFTRMAISRAVRLQYTSGSNFGLKNRKFLTAGNSVFTMGLVINVGGREFSDSRP